MQVSRVYRDVEKYRVDIKLIEPSGGGAASLLIDDAACGMAYLVSDKCFENG